MTEDIKRMVARCQECRKMRPSQPMEPLVQNMNASRPFEEVSIDLGYLDGVHYLILMDRYSGWPMVKRLTKLNTKSITNILDDWFIDMGEPVRLRSDGGPQF